MREANSMNDPDLQSAPQRGAGTDIDTAARQIAAAARERSNEIDTERQLPDELVALLRDSGLLRGGAPVEVGGLELAPAVALRSAEELARGDASTGWSSRQRWPCAQPKNWRAATRRPAGASRSRPRAACPPPT